MGQRDSIIEIRGDMRARLAAGQEQCGDLQTLAKNHVENQN
jgi:hypothetical protein